jgi:hypothetical protein
MFEHYNPSEQSPAQTDNVELQNQAKSGANWFYWIAGLSLVNALILLFDGGWSFILGLGVTQIISVVANSIAPDTDSFSAIKIGAFFVNLLIMAIFALIAYFANKGLVWIFVVGIVLYTLDAFVWLLLGNWIGFGFHGFALFFIVRGLMAPMKLNKMQPALNTQ